MGSANLDTFLLVGKIGLIVIKAVIEILGTL